MLASSHHVYFYLTDQQPPTITCPPNSSNGTDPERPTRTVTWNDPVVSDNSELHNPNAAPTVVRSPSHITSPYDFPVGVTRITYTATDRSNLSSSCVFTVTVEGEFLFLAIMSSWSMIIFRPLSQLFAKFSWFFRANYNGNRRTAEQNNSCAHVL